MTTANAHTSDLREYSLFLIDSGACVRERNVSKKRDGDQVRVRGTHHPLERAGVRLGLILVRALEHARHAKVAELWHQIVVEQHVARRQIAMHDILVVQVRHSVAHALEHHQHCLAGQLFVRLQQIVKRAARHKLEYNALHRAVRCESRRCCARTPACARSRCSSTFFRCRPTCAP